MSEWKKFSQRFTITKKRNWLQKFVDSFTGNRYAIEEVEINFLYLGEVEPEVILSGFYIVKVEAGEKKLVDF